MCVGVVYPCRHYGIEIDYRIIIVMINNPHSMNRKLFYKCGMYLIDFYPVLHTEGIHCGVHYTFTFHCGIKLIPDQENSLCQCDYVLYM